MSTASDHPRFGLRQLLLGGKPFEYDLGEELQISRSDLEDEILEQPSKYAFAATLYANYHSRVLGLEVEVKQKFAELFLRYKGESENGKPLSDWTAEQRVRCNPQYVAIQTKLQQWREGEAFLAGAVDAFKQRRDSLISMTSLTRGEMELELAGLGRARERKPQRQPSRGGH